MVEEPSLNVLVIDDTESHASLVSSVVAKTGRKIGADTILSKPFPLADLRETVAPLLENRRTGGNIPTL